MVGSEHDNFIVNRAISFSALKALYRVVERGICGIKLKGLIRYDFGSLPAAIRKVKVTFEHVVSHQAAKGVSVVWPRLLFEFLTAMDLQVIGKEGLLFCRKVKARLLKAEAQAGPRCQQIQAS